MKFRGGSLTALLKAGERCQGWDTRCKKTEELQQSCVETECGYLESGLNLGTSIQHSGERREAGGWWSPDSPDTLRLLN